MTIYKYVYFIFLLVFLSTSCGNKVEILEQENSILIQRLQVVKDSLIDAQNDALRSELENERLQNEIEVTERNYTDLILELNTIQDQFAAIEKRAKERGELEYELIEGYKRLARNGDLQNNSLVDDITTKLSTIHNMNLESLDKIKTTRDEIARKGYKITALEIVIEDLQGQIEIKEAEVRRQQEDINNLEYKVRVLNAQLSSSSEQWAQEKASKESEITRLKMLLGNEKRITKNKTEKIDSLEHQNDRIRANNKSLADYSIEQENFIISLQNQIHNLEKNSYTIPDCAKGYLVSGTADYLQVMGLIEPKRRGYKIDKSLAERYASEFNFAIQNEIYSERGAIMQIVYPENADKYFSFVDRTILVKDKSYFKRHQLIIAITDGKAVPSRKVEE